MDVTAVTSNSEKHSLLPAPVFSPVCKKKRQSSTRLARKKGVGKDTKLQKKTVNTLT